MYKEAFSFIGSMLDAAAAGDKWAVLDHKQDAFTASKGNEYIQEIAEQVHAKAIQIMEEKGVIR